MRTPQHKIDSGFGARSTPADVLAGIDLTGRTAIVTGGYSGLGLETTRGLAEAGAHVIVPARRPEHAAHVFADLGFDVLGFDAHGLNAHGLNALGRSAPGRSAPGRSVEVAALDLADQASVRAFAEAFLASDRSVDILINNAAIMASPEARVGPGWESQFATNHLGHYTLTNLLWPALVRDGGARVVALSSAGHKLSPIRFDDPHFTTGYDKWTAYGQAKTADSLFAVHLDALGQDQGVRAFAVHPGGIMTELQRHLPREEMLAKGWFDEDGNINERLQDAGAGRVDLGVGRDFAEACRPRRRLLRRLRHRRTDTRRHAGGPDQWRPRARDRSGGGRPPLGAIGRADGRQRVRLTTRRTTPRSRCSGVSGRVPGAELPRLSSEAESPGPSYLGRVTWAETWAELPGPSH